MNTKEIVAYTCAKCGKGYTDKSIADKCCETKYCEDCGKELEYKWYKTICPSCSDKRDYDKAIKVTYNDYMLAHKDNFYTLCRGDNYYTDIDELFDSLDEDEFNEITHCNGVCMDRCELNHESIIDEFISETDMEDFEVDKEGYEEFKVFLEQWNKKYGTDRYSVDYKVVILIDDKLKEEYKC